MQEYRISLETRDDGHMEWLYKADDALHAMEQFVDSESLDSETHVRQITVELA